MRNWGWGVSCLGYSLQIAELIFVLHCVWFKTSMLFLFSLWQLFTDEKKALGSGWDTIKQECGLLIPLVEENHLPTLLWVVSEKETFIMFKPLYWIGQKVCSGFSFCCCSVPESCQILWDPMDCSTPGFPVLHYLPEFAQTHVHGVDNAIQTCAAICNHVQPWPIPNFRTFSPSPKETLHPSAVTPTPPP